MSQYRQPTKNELRNRITELLRENNAQRRRIEQLELDNAELLRKLRAEGLARDEPDALTASYMRGHSDGVRMAQLAQTWQPAERLRAELAQVNALLEEAVEHDDVVGKLQWPQRIKELEVELAALRAAPEGSRWQPMGEPVTRVSDDDCTITTQLDTIAGGTWIAVAVEEEVVHALHVAGDVRLCKRGGA